MTSLIPHTSLCARCCSNSVVRHVGFLRKRGLCPACLIIEAAASTVRATKVAIVAAVLTAASVVIALVAYLLPRQTPVVGPLLNPAPASLPPQPPAAPIQLVAIGKVAPIAPAHALMPPGEAHVSPASRERGGPATVRADAAVQSIPPPQPESPPIVTATAEIIPVIQDPPRVAIETTVTPPRILRRAVPQRALTLPLVPEAFRAPMSGRCLILTVTIDETGNATAVVDDAAGVNEFFVRAALRNASQTWTPAVNERDESVPDTRVIQYCWP